MECDRWDMSVGRYHLRCKKCQQSRQGRRVGRGDLFEPGIKRQEMDKNSAGYRIKWLKVKQIKIVTETKQKTKFFD